MPPLSELFGEPERLLGELYPYRVPLTAAAVLVAIGGAVLAHRRDLDRAARSWAGAHRVAAVALAVVALATAVPFGSYALSPLWERSLLSEPSPLEAAAAPAARTATPSAGAPVTAEAATTPVPVTAAPSTTAATAPSAPRVLRQGTLRGADAFHFGQGRVLLIDAGDGRRVLRFEELSVRNGPDLFVYLAPSAAGVAGAVNLGGLKATDGAFNYELPAQVDGAALGNALIWCRQFGVLFASAALTEGS